MKKTIHTKKKGGRSKYNAQLFGNGARVLMAHPLRLGADENKFDAYVAGANKAGFSAEIQNKKADLESLLTQHIKGLPQKFRLRLCENKAGQTLLWAQVAFKENDDESIRQAQMLVQCLAEPLQSFGARYGKSEKSWLFLLPGFDSIDRDVLLETFLAQQALHWTRISCPIRIMSVLNFPRTDLTVYPLAQLSTLGERLKASSDSLRVPLGAAFLSEQSDLLEPSADAIKLMTTIQHDAERIEAAKRLNMGRPNIEESEMHIIQKYKGQLLYHIFLSYVRERGLDTVTYDKVRADRCLHHNVRMDAEATIQDVLRQGAPVNPADILIIEGLNPGINPLLHACELAAKRTIEEFDVRVDAEGRLFCDRIFRLHGEGRQIQILPEEVTVDQCVSIRNLC